MKEPLILLLVISLFSASASASASATTSLKQKMNSVATEHEIPGVSMIVASSEEILFSESVGVKNLNTNEPLKPSDYMHLGSCSKAITGYLAGVFVEKGLINWNSTVIDIYPELKNVIKTDYHDVTLNDLLSHHAGVLPLPEIQDFIDYEEKHVKLREDLKEVRYNFVKWALNHEPVKLDSVEGKEDFIYSNAGYVVAAAILEHVSGESWEMLIQQHIFKEMNISGLIGWPASIDIEQPWGHWKNEEKTKIIPVDPRGKWQISNFIDPAGDIAMSANDYGKWLQRNLKGLQGKDKKFSKDFYEYLHYANFEHSYYSMGWGSFKDSKYGNTLSNHSGSADTFYTFVLIIKELDLAIAVMSNIATDEAKSGIKELAWGYYYSVAEQK